jgi:transcriptional regulator GlxA family with amidase domain
VSNPLEVLARSAGLSVRTLYRRCVDRLGTTPAKLVEKLRVEQARTLLTTTDLPAKILADRCGFGSSARMNRAFGRELGMGSREFRMLRGRATE